MNKKLLALAIGAAITFPTAALAGPTVYGKVNVSLESEDNGSDDQWNLNSNASRFGIKGSEDLGDGLEAIYRLEYEVFVDDGNKAIRDDNGDKVGVAFTQRNIFGGFKGSFGEIITGKFDTPLKKAQGKIDLFGDLSADIKQLLAGETRASNLIQYTSPKIADAIRIKVALQPGENAPTDNGLSDATSISVEYKANGLFVALAADSDMKSGSAGVDVGKAAADIMRLTAQYKMDNAGVGFLYQTAELSAGGNAEDTSMILSGYYKMGDIKLKAQYGMTEGDLAGDEATQITVGLDYALSKKSKLYGYVSSYEYEASTTSSESDSEADIIGVGYQIKF